MRRLLVALPVALVLAAGVAAVSGAFSSGHTQPSTMAPMSMPTAAAKIRPATSTVELHRRVVQVKISNFAFVPKRLVVSPGTKVVWTNEDSDPHTVTTDAPGFSSQALDTGSRYTRVLTRTGTTAYHCTIHPFMHGAVVVQG
jgi:plastocyanin